jgi:hypothetical protein
MKFKKLFSSSSSSPFFLFFFLFLLFFFLLLLLLILTLVSGPMWVYSVLFLIGVLKPLLKAPTPLGK